ncbi:phage major tail protein, TP901-1 family [Melissococcus sp. OM08-11BH]|uniref:phage major tail protein, TP901-1 family n=1 Tax=Melissococcus sp. OM08-11BH TaxID=2293110 RepID=UPI000E4A95D4|nr:phage major tail protein, TP901-1 family [Melissococcus sp. OM08-11BH]RGI30850.1 phage major tail protein, TP901-1 family [Melissococcus sp. OM08-11BH]
MAKIAGVDVLLHIKNSDGKLVAVAGQTGTDLELSADTIDVTDKNSNGWKTAIAGLKSWSMSSDGFVDLGENSLPLLRKSFLDRKPIPVTIRMGESTDVKGVTFTGDCYITSFPHSFKQDDAVTYSLDLEGATGLTVKEGKDETVEPLKAK